MRISVNCMTRGPGARVAATLQLLRPAVDEILVALDDRAAPGVAAALSPVADRLVRYPYAEPVDRPLAWLHAECAGEWVLTIDDDEIASTELVAALPELVQAEDVTHYWIPRRWLYPDAGRYLAQAPWWPDYMLRLVRNDPKLLRFPDETHLPIDVLGPGRYLELPLYHADCIVSPLERRQEKAARYARLRPGKRVAGLPLNQAYYLPELLPGARTEPVPAVDAERIRAVLAVQERSGESASAAMVTVSREEIDRHWEGRVPAESAYRAALTLLEEVGPLAAGELRQVDVRVENDGDERWPWGTGRHPEIRLSYRWRGLDGNPVVADGIRTPLPVDVLPGSSEIVRVSIEAPPRAGLYVLELDLVHEHVRWFGIPVLVPIEVGGRRRLGLIGDYEGPEAGGLRDDLLRLAETAPGFEPVVLTGRPERVADSGAAAAPGAQAYLLADLPRGRARAATTVVLRATRLVRSARGGSRDGLPPSARALLETLAGIDVLVDAARRPDARERPSLELTAHVATVLAAEGLGVPTLRLADRAPERGFLDRSLAALAGRHARTEPAEHLGEVLAELARTGETVSEPTAPPPEWEYVPEGFARASDPRVKGWDVDAVVEAQRAKWPGFVRAVESSRTLAVYHETVEGEEPPEEDPSAQTMLLAYSYVLALAAQGRERISVLDWGGGSGHYFVIGRAALPGVELDYHVKDVPKLAALGRELCPEVTFHDDDAPLERRFDLVLASGSLQYADDWAELLGRLGRAADRLLFVTRLPVAFRAPSFVVLQRAHAYGYDTEYLGWVVNRNELLERGRALELELQREFLLQASFSALGAPESPIGHRGFLFRPRRR